MNKFNALYPLITIYNALYRKSLSKVLPNVFFKSIRNQHEFQENTAKNLAHVKKKKNLQINLGIVFAQVSGRLI